MLWTIIKADLLWIVMTLPFTIGLQLLVARRSRQAQLQATRAWMRSEQTPEQKFKLAQMRTRRWKK